MENKIIVSRSVVLNPINDRYQKKNFEIHKFKLQTIKNRKSSLPSELQQQQQHFKNIQSSKMASNQVNKKLNQGNLENKALIDHLQKIMKRKSESFKELKKYKNSHLENEKQEIEKQNKLLFGKIDQLKRNRLSKKQLKRTFKDYEFQKKQLRKVSYETKKHSKSKAKKSLSKNSARNHEKKSFHQIDHIE